MNFSRMALEKRSKRDKDVGLETESHLKDIRAQLGEQLKCLDSRLEAQLAMLWELQDFYRRRAELEQEYSKALDRLVKQIMMRHKADKQRRELWPGFSTYTCWQTLLASTKRQSKDHSIMADVYQGQMCSRLGELLEDIQRVYRKCRDIGGECHEELLKVLNELQQAMKTYHVYQGESKQAESKLRHVESQKAKVEQHTAKGTTSRKVKSFERQAEKKEAKYKENKMKALRARNDYLLCIEAANAAIKKYFVDDLGDIIDCMDCGYHNTLQRAMMMHISTDENLVKSRQDCITLMTTNCVSGLDQRADKQQFLELFSQPFSLPKKFEFHSYKGDEVCQISAQNSIQDELLERCKSLNSRLGTLKLQNDEVWKTLETAEKSLMEMINQKDYDVSSLFMEENRAPKSPHEHAKKRSDRLETEDYYVQKFQIYVKNNNLMARLHAKHHSLQKALGETGATPVGVRPPSMPAKPNKKRKLGQAPIVGQPKLFGGSIEEYVEVTGQEIPQLIKSCIKIINLYGMHHQGVFRVSGSQHEINDYKNSFEKGIDPLFDVSDGRDINSVAGLLKLYFRELREPLFPVQMFDELISCTKQGSLSECLKRIRELLHALPRPIQVVMKYLFAFLNHLTEYSDENMMDPFNLAICFGPTLLPIPQDRDQVQFQGHVNELIKNIIIHQDQIFPDISGPTYEKCIVEDIEREDSTDNLSDEDDEPEEQDIFFASFWKRFSQLPEPEVLEAVARYDFSGRTDRELTFRKGDTLVVFCRRSPEWWEGACKGREGLIPDQYITIKSAPARDEDQASVEEDKRRSTESLPAKAFNTGSLLKEEGLDKSASQPNIAVTTMTASTDADSVSDMTSQSSLTSDVSDVSGVQSVGEVPVVTMTMVEDAEEGETSTDELSQDIDNALAEVMSGLESLHMQQHPKHTPDLVLDLPITSQRSQVKDTMAPVEEESPPGLTTAEVFAKSDQSTIKKGQMPRSASNFNTVYGHPNVASSSIKRSQSSMTGVHTQAHKQPAGSQSEQDAVVTSTFNNNRPQFPPTGKAKLQHTISDSGGEDERLGMSVAQKAATLERTGIGFGGVYPMLGRPSPSPSPEPPEKPPKPSLRPKPPVMRKPRSPEVWKKMKPERDGSPY